MYSVVLLIAVTSGSESIDCRGRKCRPSRSSCYSAAPVTYGCGGYSAPAAYSPPGGYYAPPVNGCGGVVIVPNGSSPTPGSSSTPPTEEEKQIFEDTMKEVEGFGEGSEPFVAEIKKAYEGSPEDRKTWLDKYTPDLSKDELKPWDDYLAGLKDPKVKEEEVKAWKDASNPGKRYYLRYQELVESSAPATLVVSLPANTQLAIDKQPTSASASQRRVFVTGTLEADKDYHYTLDATYTLNGAPVVVNKTVTLRAGKTIEVSLEPVVSVAAIVPSR